MPVAMTVEELERFFLAEFPRAFYPATLHAAVTLSMARAHETGREVVILRPFGPYGPGDRPERLIPYVMTRLIGGGSFIGASSAGAAESCAGMNAAPAIAPAPPRKDRRANFQLI